MLGIKELRLANEGKLQAATALMAASSSTSSSCGLGSYRSSIGAGNTSTAPQSHGGASGHDGHGGSQGNYYNRHGGHHGHGQ